MADRLSPPRVTAEVSEEQKEFVDTLGWGIWSNLVRTFIDDLRFLSEQEDGDVLIAAALSGTIRTTSLLGVKRKNES